MGARRVAKSDERGCGRPECSFYFSQVEIEIQKGIDEDDMITAIFHEIVHVKQGARKELVDTGFCTKTWCGVEYICITSTTKEYMAQPWEAEAYYLQEELFTEYQYGA